jgi:Tol biopolymer transport system component
MVSAGEMKIRLAIASALAVLVTAAPAHAAFPGNNGPVAFASDRDGNFEIYRLDLTGATTRLTTNTAFDARPAYSPNGFEIAFESERDGDTAIYTMTANGAGQARISGALGADDFEPAWSPDGSRIAFSTTRDSNAEVYVMNADGSGAVDLTNASATVDVQPAWSPDGSKIAFVRAVPGFDYDVWVMNADGTGQTDLTSGTPSSGESHPNWAPDGSKIAFDSDRTGAGDVYSMNADGSGVTRLTTNAARDAEPAWAPDGTRIAFDSARDGNSELYEMDANGANPVRMTVNTANDASSDWSPGSGYPRPKGASPLRLSMVPAYQPCAASNRTHGAPLAFPSCAPPAQVSPNLTVGTGDANGADAKSIGYVRLTVAPGVPGPPDDSDVKTEASITDVRCAGAVATCGAANAASGADYTGELQVAFVARLTDHSSSFSPNESTTTTDFPFRWRVLCNATADTSVGSACTTNTTFQAVLPGSVHDTRRAIWEISQLRLDDGGADGDADTLGDNMPFAVQGLFVP